LAKSALYTAFTPGTLSKTFVKSHAAYTLRLTRLTFSGQYKLSPHSV